MLANALLWLTYIFYINVIDWVKALHINVPKLNMITDKRRTAMNRNLTGMKYMMLLSYFHTQEFN